MTSVHGTTSINKIKFHAQSYKCRSSIVCFTGIYSLAVLTTSTLFVYISSQITTLEKQFGFTSSQSGLLQSCNEIGYLAFSLLVSYKARTTHIPRGLGIATIMYGLSGVWCSCAYFFNPNKLNQNGKTNSTTLKESLMFCTIYATNTSRSDEMCDMKENDVSDIGVSTSFTPWAMLIIATGMILQGAAKSPRMPFAAYYIDENVSKRNTSVHLGVVIAIGIFGPALAFALGAVFSNMYVTLEDTDITQTDQRWIGAWWLGFIAFGLMSTIIALPLFCFPKHMKKEETRNAIENEGTYLTCFQFGKDFVSQINRLLRNGCFTFSTLGCCAYAFYIAGWVAFSAKYLETQFMIPAWHANLLLGGLNISSASIGCLIGGVVVYKYRFTPFECVRLTLIGLIVITIGATFGIYVGCNNPDIVGYNVERQGNTSICYDSCNCNDGKYFPVCGSDQRTYFSSCHAGCTDRTSQGFNNCTCIEKNGTAVAGVCPTQCNMLYVYVVLAFVFSLLGNMSIMPGYIFTIRCVDNKDKAMAIGLRSTLQVILGWFPAPVLYGKIIDTCCLLWYQSCGKSGACSLYDINDFRYKKHGLDIGVAIVAAVLYFIAFILARKRVDLKYRQRRKTEIETRAEDETNPCLNLSPS